MANRRLLLGLIASVGLLAYVLLNSDDTLLKYVLLPAEQSADSPVLVAAGQGETPAEPRAVALNPLMLPAESLSEIVERPLFNPTRAPRAEAPPPPPPPEPVIVEMPVEEAPAFDPSDYTLLGVIASAETRRAMIRSNKTDEIFHLTAGEKLMDLTVEAVDAREVTLRLGEDSYKLKLFENPGQNTPQPPQMDFQQQAPLNADGTIQ